MSCTVQRPTVTATGSIVFQPFVLDADIWNRAYNFVDTMKYLSSMDPRLLDPTFLVMQAPLSLVASTYRQLTVAQLLALARSHSLYYGGRRKDDLYVNLSSHSCTVSCGATLYVFKQRASMRTIQPWDSHVNMERWAVVPSEDANGPTSLQPEHSAHASNQPSPSQRVMTDEELNWGDKSRALLSLVTGGGRPRSDRASSVATSTTSTSTFHTSRSPSVQKSTPEPSNGGDDSLSDKDTDHLDPVSAQRERAIIKEWHREMDLNRFTRRPCAVCSTLAYPRNLSKVDGRDINLSLLRNEELPDHVLPVTYDLDAYHRAILDPEGLDDRTRLGSMNICKNCLADLSRQVMPRFALANWLYYARDRLPSNVSDGFSQMSIFEKSLISRVRTNSILCRFSGIDDDTDDSSFTSKRRFIKGNIISTPLDVLQVNNLLPPSQNEIRDTICAIFVSSRPPTTATIDKLHPILVRKSRVKTLIEFLVENNPHYRACETFGGYSVEHLETLFDGTSDIGVPTSVRIGHLPTNEAVESAVSDYVGRLDGVEGLFMENVAYTLGDRTAVSYREMSLYALQHCKDKKPFLSSRSGSIPVPDINNPNWLSWAHPNADPFGIGGFHHPRQKRPISMEQQLKHLLNVRDPFFENDPELAFDVYNIIRKGAVNTSLRFGVLYSSYADIVKEISRIDKGAVNELRQQFQRNPNYQPTTDNEKRILRIMTSISPVARGIPGSVAQRIKMRNEIRAIIGQRGSPTLFVTLNPSDYSNPLVTVLATRCSSKEDVDRLIGMSLSERTSIALKHPVSCAQFFDIMINRFVRTILRYDKSGTKKGIFGTCDAYYGTIETQGRGSLHCHMLIWIKGHLPPETLASTLGASEEYRNRLTTWLDSIINTGFIGTRKHLNLPSSPQDRNELGMPETHPATITGPRQEQSTPEAFDKEMKEYVDDLLLLFNWHTHSGACWKYLRPGDPRVDENCRFGMDGTTTSETRIDPVSGTIHVRRLHPRMTQYNPILTFLMKCNTDIKFIGSGEDAKAFMYYVTDYITKAPLSMHAGLTALSYAIRQGEVRGVLNNTGTTEDDTRRAMTIAVNSMLGNQEISHPQVMSFIHGGGEKYASEKFNTINWGEVKRYVEKGLNEPTSEDAPRTNGPSDSSALTVSVTVETGRLNVSSQLLDYIYRPDEEPFQSMGLYQHLSSTIKIPTPAKPTDPRRAAKRRSTFGNFISDRHPQFRTHALKQRRTNLTPVLLGPRIARRHGSEAERERWAQDICILFKPWRTPTDLKHEHTSWYEHLQSLLPTMSPKDTKIIDNMSLLADAKQARDERPRRARREATTCGDAATDMHAIVENAVQAHVEENIFSLLVCDDGPNMDLSSMISDRLQSLIGAQATDAFHQCLEACRRSAIDNFSSHPSPDLREGETAMSLVEQASYMLRYKGRGQVMENEPSTNDDSQSNNPQQTSRRPTAHPPSTIVATIRQSLREDTPRGTTSQWDAAKRLMEAKGITQNPEQRRAFTIIAHHVIEGGPQLLMYIGGRGGSGKSYLIEAVVELFQILDRSEQLRMGALTGIAASLIGGSTLHSLLAINPNNRKTSTAKLTDEWRKVNYLIIDETSMIGAQFLANISARLKMAKGDVSADCTKLLGGINVIFTGDFYQLSPPKQPSLFSHKLVRDPTFIQTRNNDGVDAISGAYLWRQVSDVVLLKQNKRQGNDPTLTELLERVRMGTCLDKDGRPNVFSGHSVVEHLRKREISYVSKHTPDTLQLFADAPVIVGSKTLRDALNASLLRAHADRIGTTVQVYYSRDTIHRQKANEGTAKYLWNMAARYTNDSLGQLPLFVGMKVMITENVSVAFRVVNGSEGIVHDIRYSVDEHGRRFADVVYVKLQRCAIHVPGLSQGVVPIFPTSVSITHPISMESIKAQSYRRQQIPIVPSYSYTDYKSQGRTLERAIIDLTSSRGQGIYVMLSRVKSLEGLLILRWFPDNKILQRMSGELRDEIARLEALDQKTTSLFDAGTLAPSPLDARPLPEGASTDLSPTP